MRILGYSKAMYATWLYFEALRLLCDAGEGLNCHLEGRLIGLRQVLLTHGHTDHFTGLHNVLITRLRALQQGDPLPTLEIAYPEGDRELDGYFDYLKRALLARTPGLATVSAVAPGARFALPGARGVSIEAFGVAHRPPAVSLGYRVLQERWRLKPEFVGRPQSELNRLIATSGRTAVAERRNHPLIVISGDSVPLDPAVVGPCDLLVHEATFLRERLEGSHSTLEDVVRVFCQSGAQKLLLYHVSARHSAAEIEQALAALLPDTDRARVWCVIPSRLFDDILPLGGM